MLQLTWRNWLRSFYQVYCLSSSLVCMVTAVQQARVPACESPSATEVCWDWLRSRGRQRLLLPLWIRLGADWAARTVPCRQPVQACRTRCCFVLCLFPAAWELEISFELVLMYSLFCLAQPLCLIPTNTLTQFSGESLASEVAIKAFYWLQQSL